MLRIYKDISNYEDMHLTRVSETFNAFYQEEWLRDEFCVNLLDKIGKIDITKEGHLISREFGPLSYQQLANGIKNVLLMYFVDDLRRNYIFDGSKFGNNLATYIQYVATLHDISISHCYIMDLDEEVLKDNPIYIVDSDKYCHTIKEYVYGVVCS